MSDNRAMGRVLSPQKSIAPAAITATTTGSAVDLSTGSGYMAAVVIVDVGVVTDGTHAIKLQDSPDNSAWTDVAAGSLDGAFTANVVTNTYQKVSYLGLQRYVRVVSTVSGTTTGAVYGAIVLLAKPRVV